VWNQDPRVPVTTPSDRCGYQGLDHTIYFRNAFVTCPYGDGNPVLDSVAALDNRAIGNEIAFVAAEKLEATLYASHTTPILVRCDWQKPMLPDGTVPKSIAVPMILEREVPCWHWSGLGETWESMRPYFLGTPHGGRSSLFINQETGAAIKRVWQALIESGAFGPIKV